MFTTGNALIAQSGGPTAVINASLYGVILECLKHSCIQLIYGAKHGIYGLMQEQFIDLSAQKSYIIKGLKHTPGAALGSVRYQIQERDYERILTVLKKYNIRYFFYIGGNDSMDTADKVDRYAKTAGYELCCIGIPKTVDNDLPFTDHCPGYGSAAKYLAVTAAEIWLDQIALPSTQVVILETMGRNTGWLAAATTLAKSESSAGPHLIYLPELPFQPDQFLADVNTAVKNYGCVLVVVAEGIRTKDHQFLTQNSRQDSFGHTALEGCAPILKALVETELGVKSRSIIPASAQRAAMHLASLTDMNEASLVGSAAVRYGVSGLSGIMVTLNRKKGTKYDISASTVPLSAVANLEKQFPCEWINSSRNGVTQDFIDYAKPLIMGEPFIFFDKGLPTYVRLS